MLCMNLADLDACDDIAALRQAARASLLERDATIVRIDQELQYRQTRIDALLFELARFKRWRWAAQSEALTAQQRHLFEDSLAEDIQTVEQALKASPAASVPLPGRQGLPAHLPRIEHRYERADCQCAVCRQPLTLIGEEVSEQLDCEPIRCFVHRHIRPKYACRQCQTVSAEPLPAQVIDKGLAAPGLLAQVLIGKYQDHQPLYRQETLYQRSGIALTRSTLAGWVGPAGWPCSRWPMRSPRTCADTACCTPTKRRWRCSRPDWDAPIAPICGRIAASQQIPHPRWCSTSG